MEDSTSFIRRPPYPFPLSKGKIDSSRWLPPLARVVHRFPPSNVKSILCRLNTTTESSRVINNDISHHNIYPDVICEPRGAIDPSAFAPLDKKQLQSGSKEPDTVKPKIGDECDVDVKEDIDIDAVYRAAVAEFNPPSPKPEESISREKMVVPVPCINDKQGSSNTNKECNNYLDYDEVDGLEINDYWADRLAAAAKRMKERRYKAHRNVTKFR